MLIPGGQQPYNFNKITNPTALIAESYHPLSYKEARLQDWKGLERMQGCKLTRLEWIARLDDQLL